jgi:hypothetical protein
MTSTIESNSTTEPFEISQFCDRENYSRPWMMEPFNIGEHTYATDGHICVRVPRRPDVAENPEALNAAELFAVGMECNGALPVLPPETREVCYECEGEGHLFDCEACDDRGYISSDDGLSIEVSGVPFAANLLRMISALPGINVSIPSEVRADCTALAFRFDGGEGRVMAMRWPDAVHMRAGETFEQATRETHRKTRLAMIERMIEEGYLQRTGEHAFAIAEEWRADPYTT